MEWFLKVVRDNYANFNGRARRKEFWMYNLITFVVTTVLYILMFVLAFSGSSLANFVYAIIAIIGLGLLVPSLAVSARRLHDTNKSGWMILLAFIPIVSLYLIYLLILEGDKGSNQYGPDPKGGENEDPFSDYSATNNPFSDENNPFRNNQ